VAERGEVRAVATGAAGRVEGDAGREAVEELADELLLDLEELVPRLVVRLGPAGVAFGRRDGTGGDPFAQLFGGVEELPDLTEAGQVEGPVVVARERPEQAMPSRPIRYASGCW
jgi:hypothetical protein